MYLHKMHKKNRWFFLEFHGPFSDQSAVCVFFVAFSFCCTKQFNKATKKYTWYFFIVTHSVYTLKSMAEARGINGDNECSLTCGNRYSNVYDDPMHKM